MNCKHCEKLLGPGCALKGLGGKYYCPGGVQQDGPAGEGRQTPGVEMYSKLFPFVVSEGIIYQSDGLWSNN